MTNCPPPRPESALPYARAIDITEPLAAPTCAHQAGLRGPEVHHLDARRGSRRRPLTGPVLARK